MGTRALKVARLMGDAMTDGAELVGDQAQNLVQLDTEAALPAVSGKNLTEILADASLDWGNRSPIGTFTDTQDVNLPWGVSFIQSGGATPNMPETCVNGWLIRMSAGSDYPDSSGANAYYVDTFIALNFDGATGGPNAIDVEHRWTRVYASTGGFSDWKRVGDGSQAFGSRQPVYTYNDCNDPQLPLGTVTIASSTATDTTNGPGLNTPTGQVGLLTTTSWGSRAPDVVFQTFHEYADSWENTPTDIYTRGCSNRFAATPAWSPWEKISAGKADTADEAKALSADSTVTLDDLSNVTAPAPVIDQYLKWDGTAWIPAAVESTGGISAAGDEFNSANATGNGVTTTYAITHDAGKELVYLNGILQLEGAGNDYTANATLNQITFATAPASGTVIQLRGFSAASVV